MNDVIMARESILDQIVALRNGYREMRSSQSSRLEAISLSRLPDSQAIDAEHAITLEESALLSRFFLLVDEFPTCKIDPIRTKTLRTQSWFGLRRPTEVLVEEAEPMAVEISLQNARLLHLVNALMEDLTVRRGELQNASYLIKRVVVDLNQVLSFSDESGERQMERDRYILEVLVSIIERAIRDAIIASRRLSLLSESLTPQIEEDTKEPLVLAE